MKGYRNGGYRNGLTLNSDWENFHNQVPGRLWNSSSSQTFYFLEFLCGKHSGET